MSSPTECRDPLLTIRQLADGEGVPEWKVRDWLRGPSPLPHYRVAGIRIRLSEYMEWLSRRAVASRSAEPSTETR